MNWCWSVEDIRFSIIPYLICIIQFKFINVVGVLFFEIPLQLPIILKIFPNQLFALPLRNGIIKTLCKCISSF